MAFAYGEYNDGQDHILIENNSEENTENLYLFADNQNGIATDKGNYRLYNMKINENNELIRDFQPVLDNNNIPCLMDKVNRKYYYNKGEGQFRTREQYNYKPISWIQGDGDNYIDIGSFTIDTNSKFKVKASVESSNTGANIIDINLSAFRFYHEANKFVTYESGTYKTISADSNIVECEIIPINTYSDKIISLFKKSANNVALKGASKIYYLQIYQSDELVFDGIPVLDSNNIPCLYDKVSKQFFYNQGTGEFSYGIEELECPKIDYVEYMEFPSESVNYRFDTGLPFDNTWSKIEIKFNTMNNNAYSTLINTSNEHYSLSSFSLRYNYGVIFFVSKTNKTNNNNFQIGEYNGVFQKNTDITLTYTPLNWNINGIDYPMNVESIDSSTGNLILCYSDMYSNRLYSYKVWDVNGELIQYLQPSVDDNEVVFLYDIISGNSIYCQQNNDLLKYGDLSDYTPITYIESDGKQYIDTEVITTDNTEINMTCRATNETPLYIMNGLTVDTTYKYNTTDTNIQPNLTASEGATLTLGETNLAFLSEEEIEQAINDGWNLL